jgi:hypothetical protein
MSMGMISLLAWTRTLAKRFGIIHIVVKLAPLAAFAAMGFTIGSYGIGALAHLGLGRAYALSGDTVKAKTAYQDFLALWKNADADVPLLTQAKAEYAKLP